MTILVIAIVIMGGLTIWQVGATGNQICRQILHLHRRMDGINETLLEVRDSLASIAADTDRMPKVRSHWEDSDDDLIAKYPPVP